MTQRIVEIVLDHAKSCGASRVRDVHLVVGELSGAADECVSMYFEILAEGTIAEGARLHFRRIPLEFDCLECAARFAPHRDGYTCTRCGSMQVRVAAGEELRVEAIDIDENLPADASPTSNPHAKALS
jgi:hydrogenase nickel incorporation protein HypA/HybF